MRALFGVAIVACPPLALAHLVLGWGALAAGSAEAGLAALVGLGLGMLAADATTGLVHWSFDTWGDRHTRWVGARLIQGFREHHRDPRAMCRHDWIEVNGEPALAVATAFTLLSLPPSQAWLATRPGVHAFAWSLLVFGGLANQLHQWAHARKAPRAVRALQRAGLVLSPARHARHHRAPHTRAYCISSGWLNAPLDAIGVWRMLERGIELVTGVPPRAPERGSARAGSLKEESWLRPLS